jgi:hypothetical protein
MEGRLAMTTTFIDALSQWKAAALRAAELRLTYETAFARALVASDARNAEGRKAAADLATTDAKLEADRADIEARTLQHLVLHLRSPRPAWEETA